MSDSGLRDIGGIVGETLRSRYHGIFRNEQGVVTVGVTTTGIILKQDPERISFTIVNLGSVNVMVAPTQLVSANLGILLDPFGGWITTTFEEDGALPTIEWYFFCDTPGATIYFLTSKRDVRVEEDAF